MLHAYPDILELARLLDREPKWWDENGVPRFAEHHPKLCQDIYANEVALLRVACQECHREFLVQMSLSPMDLMRTEMLGQKAKSLAAKVTSGEIHYGDPPRHEDGCAAGDTMNVDDLAVVEFWRRGSEWIRLPELERDLRLEDHS